jgi:hypothetical protein
MACSWQAEDLSFASNFPRASHPFTRWARPERGWEPLDVAMGAGDWDLVDEYQWFSDRKANA